MLGTLPIGPNEVSELWYANSRLGYTTLTAIVWGMAFPGTKHYFTYISRIVERTTTFTNAIIQDLVRRLPLATTTDMGWWSDVGPHFRAYKVLGSIGYGLVDQLRIHQHVMYGVESHMKNPCDGFFAELNSRKRIAKKNGTHW